MRTTSFYKAALLTALLSYAWGSALEQVDDAAPVQDLGVSDVVTEGEAILTKNAGYTEISSAAWEGKSLSAADLLATLPGIQSYKQGGLGSFQTVSVRGIAARNIMICVDGVPLNDASGGAVNLGSIDLDRKSVV